MIIRKRTKPLILQKYEALQARLPPNSPQYQAIKQQVELRTRGHQGELTVDHHLNILAPKFTIIQDACLTSNGQTFQIDNLIISPHSIYIIEVKNFRAPITFDTDLNQFTTDDGRKISGYKHPIAQVKAQQLKLQNWLYEHNQPNIPIYYFIAVSEPSTLINVIGDYEKISSIVQHGEHIPWKILDFEQKQKNHPTYQHQKIGHFILKHCRDFDKDILEEWGIVPEQLVPGVRCRKCNRVGMEKVKWSWICPRCGLADRQAANHSIDEYLMLVKPWLKNKEILNFLNISSRYAVSRLLKNHPNLHYSEKRRRWEKKVNGFNKRYTLRTY